MSVRFTRSFHQKGEGNYFEVTAIFDPPAMVSAEEYRISPNGVIARFVRLCYHGFYARRGDLFSKGVTRWQLIAEEFMFRESERVQAQSLGLSVYASRNRVISAVISSRVHPRGRLATFFLPTALREIFGWAFGPASVEHLAIYELQLRAYR